MFLGFVASVSSIHSSFSHSQILELEMKKNTEPNAEITNIIVEKKLGEGSFGDVYLGKWGNNQCRCFLSLFFFRRNRGCLEVNKE